MNTKSCLEFPKEYPSYEMESSLIPKISNFEEKRKRNKSQYKEFEKTLGRNSTPLEFERKQKMTCIESDSDN